MVKLRDIREGSEDIAFAAKAGILVSGVGLIASFIFRRKIHDYYVKVVSKLQASGIKATAEDLQTIQGAVSIVDASNRVEEAAQNGEITSADVIKVVEDNKITDSEQSLINFRSYCLQMGSKKMMYNPLVLIVSSAPVLTAKLLTQSEINADIQWVIDKLSSKPVSSLPY